MSYKKSFFGDDDVKIKSLAKEEARYKHFHNIDYTIEANLFPKRTFSFGALTEVIWYSDQATTDPVIKVLIDYNYDLLGFATNRTVTREWYKNDGSLHSEKKITFKDYTINPQDQLDEAIQRRTNNVRQINLWLIGYVPILTQADPNIPDTNMLEVRDDGVAFFELYQVNTTTYIETGSQLLEQSVINEVLPRWDWFDTDASSLGINGVSDIRDFIVYQLSNGQRNKNGDIT